MILMLGDVHGCFRHVLPVVQKVKPNAVIFLGDLDLERPFEQEVKEVMKLTELYFIHGNHDTDSAEKHDYLFNSSIADRNLHGHVVEIDGLKVAGLGGVFRERIWWPKDSADAEASYDNYDAFIKDGLAAERWKEYRRREKPSMGANDWKEYQIKTAAGWVPEDLPLPPFAGKALTHISTIFYDDWLNLYNQKADILVTHEAPCCHPYGFAGLTELARGMKVKKSFHGHHHDRMDYSSHNDRLGFEAHAVGYRGISDQNGVLIKPGDYDYLRSHRNVVTDN